MISQILHTLYAAADGSGEWETFLSEWTTATGGGCAAFFTQNFDNDEVGTFVTHQMDPQVFVSYSEYYAGINVFMQNEDRLPSGTAVVGQHLYPNDLLVKSEFYNDWMLPNNFFHTMGGVVVKDGSWCSKISVLRPKLDGCYSDAQFELACEIMPHMFRAVKTYNTIGSLGALHNASHSAFEQLPLAAVLVDRYGKVLYTNGKADDILSRSDGLSIGADLMITTHAQADQRLLDSLLANNTCIDAITNNNVSNRVRIRRKNNQLPYDVFVSPLRAKEYQWLYNQPGALILIADPLQPNSPSNRSLVEVYGLTPTEARITVQIVNGLTVKQVAGKLNISELTVRQHLKSIFKKTGANGQTDLVRKMLTSTLVFGNDDNIGIS